MIESPDDFDTDKLFIFQLYGATEGVWVDDKGTLYTGGSLMYQYKHGKWNYVTPLPENFIGGDPDNTFRGYLHAVQGNASNDIFIFGQSNTIIHFNGFCCERTCPGFVPWYLCCWLDCVVKENLSMDVGAKSYGIGEKSKNNNDPQRIKPPGAATPGGKYQQH